MSMTETLIQATVSIGIGLIGVALGAALQREALAVAAGRPRGRWSWATPTRVMAVGVVLLSICGILTAVSVRSCQSTYNNRFGAYLTAARTATEQTADSLIALADGVLDPTSTPAQRADTLAKFRADLKNAKALRTANPLPPPPQC